MDSNPPSVEGPGKQLNQEAVGSPPLSMENGESTDGKVSCMMGNKQSAAVDVNAKEVEKAVKNDVTSDSVALSNADKEEKRVENECVDLNNHVSEDGKEMEENDGEEKTLPDKIVNNTADKESIANCVDDGKEEREENISDNSKSSSSVSMESSSLENCVVDEIAATKAQDDVGDGHEGGKESGVAGVENDDVHESELSGDLESEKQEEEEVEVIGESSVPKTEANNSEAAKDSEESSMDTSSILEITVEEKNEDLSSDLQKCVDVVEGRDKPCENLDSIPEDKKFDSTTCDLMVFDMKDSNKEKSEAASVNHFVDGASGEMNKDVNHSIKSVYVQPVFEDITEDEDSDEEQFENIELELDDLIDTPDVSLNGSGNSGRGGNGGADPTSLNLKEEVKSSVASSAEVFNNGIVKSFENVNGVVEKKDCEKRKSYENVDPTGVSGGCGDQVVKKSTNHEKPLMRKKSTARKSGKPVCQLESAPLKRINMYPITDVTMNISEVEDALKFDLEQAKKVKKSCDNGQVVNNAVEQGQGNTYKVISVTTKSSHPGASSMKKKRKKRGYDLPGCKKKKKFKHSDDVASIGASSVDSVSLSENDLVESDSISSCSSTHVSSLAEFNNGQECVNSITTLPCSISSSSSSSSSSSISVLSSLSSPSSSSSPLLLASSTSSSSSTVNHSKAGGSNKGSNKMKSVLEMLHERNRQKAASTDTAGRTSAIVGKGAVTTSTTTTTTIMVSPPDSKPIIEAGVKRKGTPRKRRDEVICLSDDDDDDDDVSVLEVIPKGKHNFSLDHASMEIGINTTTMSMMPTKTFPTPTHHHNNMAAGVMSSGPGGPVVMMVAQHSSTPGLRSLLPRNMLVSATNQMAGCPVGMTMVRPEHLPAGLTPLPLVSTLPMGMKAVSMANLPGGLSAIPLTSLPPGSTIFTAVQGNNPQVVAGTTASPIPSTHFLNITPPKGGMMAPIGLATTNSNNSNININNKLLPSSLLLSSTSSSSSSTKTANNKSKHHSLLPPSSSSSSSSSASQQKVGSAQVNSESLRALLVGKPYALAHPNNSQTSLSSSLISSSSSSLSATPSNLITSSPVVFQMLTSKTSPNTNTLVPVPVQTMATAAAVASSAKHHKHMAKSSSSSVHHPPPTASTTTKSIHAYSTIKPSSHHHPHHSILPPNGISCLTPPKTPDTDSSSEVAVAASLTRPVGGQFEDNDVIPLCCCKINVPAFNKMLSGVTYCQALDSVDNKVLGCCNKVTNSQLVRPGVKIPFMAVCELHRKRLAMHQCCPGCGHFCSQGKFQQCRKEGTSSTHHFHKQCMFYRSGKHFCPHCGEETSLCEVELKLSDDGSTATPNRAAGRGAKNKDADKKVSARLGLGGKKSKSTSNKENNKTLTLPNKKAVDPSAIPPGPDQATLTRLCKCLGEDRPKKYRTLPKDLYSPASEGDMEKVFYLLADGMDPNIRLEDQEDQTPLHAAAISGNVGTVFILEQFGAEIHAQDRSLQTPLMCAAERGHVKVVQYLLKAGAKVEDRGEDGMTGLHYAAKSGHLDVIKLMLNTKKLDINVEDDGGWTPIIWATESMLPDIVRYLIGQGGDPNQKDNEENTSLHWAAFSGSVEIVEMLLDLGCEMDTPNEHGDRPLHIAARQDHYDIVVHLLAKGANVDVRNHKNETPVDSCINKAGQVLMALKVNQQLRGLATYKLIQPERLLDRDITMGREKNPVACVNKEDKETCPTDYLYIVQNVETSPLNINGVITGLQSCRCKDDCSSMYCVCARSSVCCWYDKTGRLVEDFNLLEPPLLFECNRACRCWVNCNNRVVQNGIVCRLQLFRTNGRGWGVRALMDIPKGTFVCEYIGELISDSEADRREDDSYLFDLDNKDGDTYCIDARKYGNVARFINHLCEPNLVPVKVFVEHQDLRFPRICFFSSKEIKAYEELGFDYGEKFWIIKWKQFTCACQSDKCKYSKDTIQKTLDDYKLRYPDEATDQD